MEWQDKTMSLSLLLSMKPCFMQLRCLYSFIYLFFNSKVFYSNGEKAERTFENLTGRVVTGIFIIIINNQFPKK